ncbi:Uncharacterized protein QTN25_001307 [Entamoeba marina]
MLSNNVVKYIQILNDDDLNLKLSTFKNIHSRNILISLFEPCLNDFTRVITSNINSMSVELVSICLEVLCDWIDYILSLPSNVVRYYDTLLSSFVDSLFYTNGELITVFINSIPTIASSSQVFLLRHFNSLLRSLSFHIPTHSDLIATTILKVLKTIPVLPCLVNDLSLFYYAIYKHKTKVSIIAEVCHQLGMAQRKEVILNYLKNDCGIIVDSAFIELFD